jgi:hypothetical protein
MTSITASGATLHIPSGWHASIARTPGCDPERLIVASSAFRGTRGASARPADGQVVVLLVEDRLKADRPVGDLRRPTHFAVRWNRLTRLEPAGFCGNPDAPAFVRYFRVRSRYLGFIVYPGRHPRRGVRAATVARMDSLSVAR